MEAVRLRVGKRAKVIVRHGAVAIVLDRTAVSAALAPEKIFRRPAATPMEIGVSGQVESRPAPEGGDRREGGFGGRREGGFGDRREGGFGDRREGGYGSRREGGGFGDRREGGGFGDRREGGGFGERRGGYGERREGGGFGDRPRYDSSWGERREGGGGFGERREGGFGGERREGGFGGERREGGFGGERREGGYRREGGFDRHEDRPPRAPERSDMDDDWRAGERTAPPHRRPTLSRDGRGAARDLRATARVMAPRPRASDGRISAVRVAVALVANAARVARLVATMVHAKAVDRPSGHAVVRVVMDRTLGLGAALTKHSAVRYSFAVLWMRVCLLLLLLACCWEPYRPLRLPLNNNIMV